MPGDTGLGSGPGVVVSGVNGLGEGVTSGASRLGAVGLTSGEGTGDSNGLGLTSGEGAGDSSGAGLTSGEGTGDSSGAGLTSGEGAGDPVGVGLGVTMLGLLVVLPAQRELSGKRSHRIFIPSGESLISVGSLGLEELPDWATTTVPGITKARAVPMKVRYLAFIALNLNKILRLLNQRKDSQKSSLLGLYRY